MAKKKKAYVLTNAVSVGMLEELLAQIKNKKSVVKIADKNGLGSEPILRGFLETSTRGRGVGLVLCGGFDFNPDEEEEDPDYEEEFDPDEDIPFDPQDMTPQKMALVYAFHDKVKKHIGAIGKEGPCHLKEPGDCEDVAQTRGIEYMAAPAANEGL